jgi:hypothetical protein
MNQNNEGRNEKVEYCRLPLLIISGILVVGVAGGLLLYHSYFIEQCNTCPSCTCPEVIQEFWNITLGDSMEFKFVCYDLSDDVVFYQDFEGSIQKYDFQYLTYGAVIRRHPVFELSTWEVDTRNISDKLFNVLYNDTWSYAYDCEIWAWHPHFDIKRYAVSEYGWFAIDNHREWYHINIDNLCHERFTIDWGVGEDYARDTLEWDVDGFIDACMNSVRNQIKDEIENWQPEN